MAGQSATEKKKGSGSFLIMKHPQASKNCEARNGKVLGKRAVRNPNAERSLRKQLEQSFQPRTALPGRVGSSDSIIRTVIPSWHYKDPPRAGDLSKTESAFPFTDEGLALLAQGLHGTRRPGIHVGL